MEIADDLIKMYVSSSRAWWVTRCAEDATSLWRQVVYSNSHSNHILAICILVLYYNVVFKTCIYKEYLNIH